MKLFRKSRRLAAAFALLAAAAAALFAFVPVHADMTILLPERQGGELALLFRSLQQGPANRTVLIGLSPAGQGALESPREISHAFRQALEATGRFDWIANGEIRQDMAAVAPFFDNRYRLNPPLDPAQFSAAGLRAALEQLLSALHGFAAPVVERFMAADPTLRTPKVAALWSVTSARTKQGVWIDEEGRQALLLARTGGAGYDLVEQTGTIAAIRAAAEAMEPKFGRLELALSGPSVIAVESRDLAEAESTRLALISVPLMVGLLLLVFRRLSALPILFLPIGCGFVAGAAATAALFGYVHITTLAFGVTLLGIAEDYPLHLMARVRAGAAADAAARRIWPDMSIAVATTILAFLPLAISSFPGLSQLGVFSVVGLAAAVVVTRWVLPHLIGPPALASKRWGGSLLPSILRANRQRLGLLRIPALLAGVAAVAMLGFRAQPLWQQDLAALSPIPEAVRARDQALRRNLSTADPRYVLTVAGKDVEEALRRSEQILPHLADLRAAKGLDGFEMAALYMPSHAAQQARLAALPADDALRRNLDRAQEGLPFKAGTFEPFLQALAAARGAPPVGPPDMREPALRARLDSLLLRSEDGVKALILLRGLRNPGELRQTVEDTGITGVRYLDLKQSAQTLMNGYRDETLRWISLGAALALALLAATLRSARAVFAVTTPVVLSVAMTAAAMALIGDGLTIFHLLGLLMVAGFGVDYAVFLRKPDGRAEDHEDEAGAVALCTATTFLAFALLATAAVPILAQIGGTVAVGTVFSFLLSLAFSAPRPGRPA
ncbi:MAG: MMPL family transporter [Alphaproteobacteria bacterium]